MKNVYKRQAFLFFILGTVFLFMAISAAGREPGWDLVTILLISFSAFDYLLFFRFMGMHRKVQAELNKKNNE